MDVSHKIHSGYFHSTLRKWQNGNVHITKEALMFPAFIMDVPECKDEILSMPGVFRYGYENIVEALRPIVEAGLKSVLLFGVLSHLQKDECATHCDSDFNPVIKSVKLLRKEYPHLIVACDVCLCAYTQHGHCGILRGDGSIDNEKSINRLATQSLAYARAGAHIIAPSDMMDCRIAAIKKILDENGYGNKVSVLSYAAKFASSFYGPFRDAANSAPTFGDRRCYQLPGGSSGLALRAVVSNFSLL
ncbi:delta-aminolevulinic acid dehydratase-like [Artemia franciscana]|uniref:delta-aminolevulinic acid dehydratase-like n=1 Tax=Artemia franciscana TaxID=6661 RepID=UPI0032DB56EC